MDKSLLLRLRTNKNIGEKIKHGDQHTHIDIRICIVHRKRDRCIDE